MHNPYAPEILSPAEEEHYANGPCGACEICGYIVEALDAANAQAEIERHDREQAELLDLSRKHGLFLTDAQRNALDLHELAGLYVRQVKDTHDTVWIGATPGELFFDTLEVFHLAEALPTGGTQVRFLEFDPNDLPF